MQRFNTMSIKTAQLGSAVLFVSKHGRAYSKSPGDGGHAWLHLWTNYQCWNAQRSYERSIFFWSWALASPNEISVVLTQDMSSCTHAASKWPKAGQKQSNNKMWTDATAWCQHPPFRKGCYNLIYIICIFNDAQSFLPSSLSTAIMNLHFAIIAVSDFAKDPQFLAVLGVLDLAPPEVSGSKARCA